MDHHLGLRNPKHFLFLSVLLTVAALWWSFYHWRAQRMGTNWIGPYLSAAQNLRPGGGVFLVNLEDVQQFKSLDDPALEDTYEFGRSGTFTPFTYGSPAYAYLIKAATLIFPFVGHQLALILLQCLFHLLLCCCILSFGTLSFRFRILFLILYAINPIVLRFVTFNFYYFWQVIPSFGLMFLYLNIKNKLGWLLVLLTLPLVILTRSTTIFISGALLILLFWYRSRILTLLYVALLAGVAVWLYVPITLNPWHTLYAGVGAYPNPDGISLSDEASYALYQKYTGVKINSSTGGNFYDSAVKERYIVITKREYLKVLQENPLLLFKNAVANVFSSFSIGYINKAPPWINYLVALSGALFVAVLFYRKKTLLLVVMALGVGGFVLYYPPIQAYMYGNYLLLVWAFIEVVAHVRPGDLSNQPPRNS